MVFAQSAAAPLFVAMSRHAQLLEPPGNAKAAPTHFVTGPNEHVGDMGFAQPGDPLFQSVQMIADRPAVTHLARPAFFGRRRRDRVLVDIESRIEFFFYSVSLLVRLHVDESERLPRSLRGALLRFCSPEQPVRRLPEQTDRFF